MGICFNICFYNGIITIFRHNEQNQLALELNKLGKVIEEYYAPFYGVDESENRLTIYRDVNINTEEGYGVVFGDCTTDRTVAFGGGALAEQLSIALYRAMIVEVERKKIDGLIPSENTVLDYEYLETVVSLDENSSLVQFDGYELLKVIAYIATYIKEE